MSSQPRLLPGEKIIYQVHPEGPGVWGVYVATLGLYKFWRENTSFTVTDQRVIVSADMLWNHSQRAVPIDAIQDASVQAVAGAGTVMISTAGGSVQEIGPVKAETARQLADVIMEQRRATRGPR